MLKTGLKRKLNQLGQVTIPKEIRDTLQITEDTELIISVDGNTILLQKEQEYKCEICGNNENLTSFLNHFICEKCIKELKEQF